MARLNNLLAGSACALAALGLAGCSWIRNADVNGRLFDPIQPLQSASAACEAQAAQFLVGRRYTDVLMEAARLRSGAHWARAVRPDQPAPLEHDPLRLTLHLDSAGNIWQVRCD